MSLVEEKLVDQALESGLLKELIEMILGENEYADKEAFDKMDVHSSRLRGLALSHLQFMQRFGFRHEEKTVKEEGLIYTSYPEYFKAWKLAGCPGISIYQLERMIKENETCNP